MVIQCATHETARLAAHGWVTLWAAFSLGELRVPTQSGYPISEIQRLEAVVRPCKVCAGFSKALSTNYFYKLHWTR